MARKEITVRDLLELCPHENLIYCPGLNVDDEKISVNQVIKGGRTY